MAMFLRFFKQKNGLFSFGTLAFALVPIFCFAVTNNLTVSISAQVGTSTVATSTPVPILTAGGGGSIGPGPSVAITTSISFDGLSYPFSDIELWRGVRLIATTTADSLGKFNLQTTKTSAGNRNYSLIAKDKYAGKSALISIPLVVIPNAVTSVSNIIFAPTLYANGASVATSTVFIYGQSISNSKVIVTSSVVHTQIFQTNRDGSFSGSFLIPKIQDNITLSAISNVGLLSSPKSSLISVTRFAESTPSQATSTSVNTNTATSVSSSVVSNSNNPNIIIQSQKFFNNQALDLNGDKAINFVDFSILLYWQQHANSNPPAAVDLNHDGKINMSDFSIMAYYWTN